MTAGDVVCTRVYEREWGNISKTVIQYSCFVPHAWFTFTRLAYSLVLLPASRISNNALCRRRLQFTWMCVGTFIAFRTPKILEPAPLCIVLKMSHVLDQKTPLFRLVNKLFYMNSLFDYSFLNTHSLCCLLTGRPTPSSSIYISHHCLPILFSWLLHILIHPSIFPLAINIVLKLTAACVQSP